MNDQERLAAAAIANAINTTGPSRSGIGSAPPGTIADRDPDSKILLGWTRTNGTYVTYTSDTQDEPGLIRPDTAPSKEQS